MKIILRKNKNVKKQIYLKYNQTESSFSGKRNKNVRGFYNIIHVNVYYMK